MTSKGCPFSDQARVAFAYGELDAEQARAFEAHLDGCPDCRTELVELGEAARLCRLVRQAPVPTPRWSRPLRLDPPAQARRWWTRPGWWIPAAAATAALAAWLLLNLPGTSTEPAGALGPGPERLALETLDLQGAVSLVRAGLDQPLALGAGLDLHAGDLLQTEDAASAVLSLADSSQVRIGAKSQARILSIGPSGDRLELLRGELACRVAPRQAGRPFAIHTGPAQVIVRGTRFGLRLDPDGRLSVGVIQGVVEVVPTLRPEAAVRIGAGEQVTVSLAGELQPAEPDATDPPERAPAARRPASGSGQTRPPRTPPAEPPSPGSPADPGGPAVTPVPAAPARPEPVAGRPEDDSLETLVARLHQDTHWIFDDLRTDMAAGRWEAALHRLANYLGDPDSPRRDEATFLKAVCLEQLGRKAEAMRTYRQYLRNWPEGTHASDSRAAMRRIRAKR